MQASEAILLLMYSKKPTAMSLDSNMPKKGSCNLLSNLSTNTLMWIHLVESTDLLTQTAIKQLPECLLSHKL